MKGLNVTQAVSYSIIFAITLTKLWSNSYSNKIIDSSEQKLNLFQISLLSVNIIYHSIDNFY